eukprot:172676_1
MADTEETLISIETHNKLTKLNNVTTLTKNINDTDYKQIESKDEEEDQEEKHAEEKHNEINLQINEEIIKTQSTVGLSKISGKLAKEYVTENKFDFDIIPNAKSVNEWLFIPLTDASVLTGTTMPKKYIGHVNYMKYQCLKTDGWAFNSQTGHIKKNLPHIDEWTAMPYNYENNQNIDQNLPGLYVAPCIYLPQGEECASCKLYPVILAYCPRCKYKIGSKNMKKHKYETKSAYSRAKDNSYKAYVYLKQNPTKMRMITLIRRMYRAILQWIDMISDITVLQLLFIGKKKFFPFFVVMVIGIIAPYLISWAVSLRWLDKHFRGKNKHFCTSFVTGLLMIPPIGVMACFCLDVYWTIEDAIINWFRLLCCSKKSRKESEDEQAYRHLRSVAGLLLESIPQAIVQTILLIGWSDDAQKLGIDLQAVIISLCASVLNIISIVFSIWRESKKHSMTFIDYALVSLQGKFGFIPQLPAIERGIIELVDWTRYEFGHESAGMFAEAISSDNSCLKTVFVSKTTFRNMSNNSIKFFVAACKSQNVTVKYREVLMMKGWMGNRVWNLKSNFSLLCHAIRTNDIPLFHFCLSEGMVDDMCCMTGQSAIMIAAQELNGDYYVNLLLKNNANVNILDEYSRTPLLLSCMQGFENLVEILLKHGADPNIVDKRSNKSCLWSASQKGYKGIVKLLLEYGANVHQVDSIYQINCLLANCYGLCDYDIVKMLIDAGVNVNGQDGMGRNSLMQMCTIIGVNHNDFEIHYDIIELLVNEKSDLTLRDKNNLNACDLARQTMKSNPKLDSVNVQKLLMMVTPRK